MSATAPRFDHLVVGAATLEDGDAWAEATFATRLGPGGRHPDFGTWNRLSRLARGYIEIIAIDPDAPPPGRARWYGLDAPEVAEPLRARPRPIAWVMAVDDIEAAAAQADWDVGRIVDAARGDLRWRITTPDDGRPPLGVAPTLIEWPEALNRQPPRERMTPLRRALTRLTLRAENADTVRRAFKSLDVVAAMARDGVELRIESARPEGAPIEAMFTPEKLDVRT